MFKRPDRPSEKTVKALEVTSLSAPVSEEKSTTRKPRKTSAPEEEKIKKAFSKHSQGKDQRDPALKKRTSQKPKRPKNEKPMKPSRIRNICEYYITQREACTGGLRQMLHRRAFQWLKTLPADERSSTEAQFHEDVEAELTRLTDEGLVNDRRYAEMKARSWRRDGRGARRIAMDLAKKDIDQSIIQDAISAADAETVGMNEPSDVAAEEGEFAAAETLAQRKRIGPYRRKPAPENRTEQMKLWKREAGVLARAGYSLDVIRQILDREPEPDDEF